MKTDAWRLWPIAIVTCGLLIAGSAGAVAAKLIGSEEVRDDSLQSVDIKDETLSGTDIRDGSLTARDVGEALVGPAGPQGEQGEQGPAGPPGPAGDRPGETVSWSLSSDEFTGSYTWSGAVIGESDGTFTAPSRVTTAAATVEGDFSSCNDFMALDVNAIDAAGNSVQVARISVTGPDVQEGPANATDTGGRVVSLPSPTGPYHLRAVASCWGRTGDNQQRRNVPPMDLNVVLEIETLTNDPDRAL